MRDLLQAVILSGFGAVIGGQVVVTRTGRLRKDILANLDLLGRLSADCPNRAELEAKNGELVGVLARRQQRRYGPFTQAGFSLGALAGVAALGLAFAGFSALLATGILPSKAASDPPTGGDYLGCGGVVPAHSGRPRRVHGLVCSPAAQRAPAAGAAADRGRLGPSGRRWRGP
jgi:hypothetical protein